MRYCTSCRRLSAGTPLFCIGCGRTFRVRLCPRLHQNSRRAEVCAQCGSRDLTEPAARARSTDRIVVLALRVLPVALVVIVPAIAMLAIVRAVLIDPELQREVMAMAVLITAATWAWRQLPGAVRSSTRSVVRLLRYRRTPRDRH